jgi:ubiquinone/menaquinone biosynthesis C-methylase UbiE
MRSKEILVHYQSGWEERRLREGVGRLERARTEELLARFLPRPPAVVLDVGGGPGGYACWLARRGYQVHLIDLVPLHVRQALEASAAQPGKPLASAEVGDARHLARPRASADVVLLLGPLYHLTERRDRLKALREARRVLRPEGIVLCAGISRYASLLDGLVEGYLADPAFARIAKRDLATGQHRNPTNNPAYFTTSYFYRPSELAEEIAAAGLRHESTVGIEGPGWLLQDFEKSWKIPAGRKRLLAAARALESEPSVLGLSAHLLAVGRL